MLLTMIRPTGIRSANFRMVSSSLEWMVELWPMPILRTLASAMSKASSSVW